MDRRRLRNRYKCPICNRKHIKTSKIGLEHECYKFVRDPIWKK